MVLFHLERMRASREFLEEAEVGRMELLATSFLPAKDWGMGDQEWITLLGWSKPHLVGLLPCRCTVGWGRTGQSRLLV